LLRNDGSETTRVDRDNVPRNGKNDEVWEPRKEKEIN
jgi:hypothetical protein